MTNVIKVVPKRPRLKVNRKGGAGSGNWGHVGIPGKRGGSAPTKRGAAGAMMSLKFGRTAFARQALAKGSYEGMKVVEEEGFKNPAPSVLSNDLFDNDAKFVIRGVPPRKYMAVVEIPISDVVPAQSHVPVGGLNAYRNNMPKKLPELIFDPFVPKSLKFPEGGLTVISGHTRIGARKLNGETTVRARVWIVKEPGKFSNDYRETYESKGAVQDMFGGSKEFPIVNVKGSAGSGNWGHAGRIGKHGGSAMRSVAMSRVTGRDWEKRQALKRLDNARDASWTGGSQFGYQGGLSVYRNEYNDWADRLPDYQSDSVRVYTGANYRFINHALRTGSWEDSQIKSPLDKQRLNGNIEGIDSALAKARQPTEDIKVFRSVDKGVVANLSVGDTFRDKGFVSTSVDKTQIMEYSANLEIVIPKGSKDAGAYVERISKISGEVEWLMPRGAMFEVIEKTVSTIEGTGIVTGIAMSLLFTGTKPGNIPPIPGSKAKKDKPKEPAIIKNRGDKFTWKKGDIEIIKKGE